MAPGCADDFSLCPQFARVFAPTPNGEIGVAFADQVPYLAGLATCPW